MDAQSNALLAKQSGAFVHVRQRRSECRSEGVRRSQPYGAVRRGTNWIESDARHAGQDDRTTMKRHRATPEQIVRKVGESDHLFNEGTASPGS